MVIRDQAVKGILVCLDCTEQVMEEAIRLGCNMIVSHHPAIFYGVKKITGNNMTERIIEKAIKNDLLLYAMHTNLDNTLTNGVNEQIARKIGLEIDGTLRAMSGDPESHARGRPDRLFSRTPWLKSSFFTS